MGEKLTPRHRGVRIDQKTIGEVQEVHNVKWKLVIVSSVAEPQIIQLSFDPLSSLPSGDSVAQPLSHSPIQSLSVHTW